MIELLHTDCMTYMKGVPDKFFDLAIVDPPYGIGAATKKFHNGVNGRTGKNKKWKNEVWEEYEIKEWDSSVPDYKYFYELFRVSKNQIVWGGNYFELHTSSGWIFWDKKNGDSSYSDGELAWSSFDRALRKFEWLWNGFQKQRPEERFHPSQKPIALYKWLLKNYAKEGDKIFDSHGGSMSIAIACHDMKFDLTLCEIDKDYYEAGVKRFNNHKMQQTLF